MSQTATMVIPQKKIIEAKKLRDELNLLIETAEIVNNRGLMQSIQKSEQDIKSGKIAKINSKKELDDYFKR